MKISHAAILVVLVVMTAAFICWRCLPEYKVDRLLGELADRPGGNIDMLWSGRSTKAIQADFDKLGTNAVPGLVKALSDSSTTVRYLAAGQLGRLGDRRAVAPLIRSTSDANVIVACWAVAALGDIGDPKAVDTLLPFLQDADSHLRFCAAKALGQIGDNRAYEPLLVLLEDRELYPKAYATEAIGRLHDQRALPVLLRVLSGNGDEWVRSMAVNGLGHLGSADALPALKSATKDESEKVRKSAEWAIGSIEQKINAKTENHSTKQSALNDGVD